MGQRAKHYKAAVVVAPLLRTLPTQGNWRGRRARLWRCARMSTANGGQYSMHVQVPPDIPGQLVVFEQAIETAIGSGTPGAFAEVGRIPAAYTGRTSLYATAPNDGKLRY